MEVFMSLKINNSEISFFTTRLTSVKHKGEERQLEFWDKAKVYAAFVIGFLFGGIGSPIAGLATSYYLRSRKVEQLTVADREIATEAVDEADVFDLISRPLTPEEQRLKTLQDLSATATQYVQKATRCAQQVNAQQSSKQQTQET